MIRRLLPLLFLLLVLAMDGARGQALLELPYGLKWGDSPEKLITWASGHSLDVIISSPGKQPALRVVRIEAAGGALPTKTGETALEARFIGGRLIELALHYADPEASANQMEERFKKLQAEVTNTRGKLIPDLKNKTLKDDFATRGESFHHEPVKGLFLLLEFTEVEDLLRKSKEARYSMLYRNDNLRLDIEKMLASPVVPQGDR